MIKFSNQQISELLSIIDDFFTLFIGTQLGSDVLTDKDRGILRNHGIDLTKLSKEGKLDEMFRFGILSEALGHKKAKNLSYQDFKKFIKSGNFTPLTEIEKFALSSVKIQAFHDSKNLAQKIGRDVVALIVEGNKKAMHKYEKIVEDTVKDAIVNRESIKGLASKLREKTGDWSRDFDRVSDFVCHDAFDRGKAMSIMKRVGEDAEVYKIPYSLACKDCVRLYLSGGIGSQPIIFKLKELIANGSNIGRKVSDWKAIVGTTHCFCRCELQYREKNTQWNQRTSTFEPTRNKQGIVRRSKAKITIS